MNDRKLTRKDSKVVGGFKKHATLIVVIITIVFIFGGVFFGTKAIQNSSEQAVHWKEKAAEHEKALKKAITVETVNNILEELTQQIEFYKSLEQESDLPDPDTVVARGLEIAKRIMVAHIKASRKPKEIISDGVM